MSRSLFGRFAGVDSGSAVPRELSQAGSAALAQGAAFASRAAASLERTLAGGAGGTTHADDVTFSIPPHESSQRIHASLLSSCRLAVALLLSFLTAVIRPFQLAMNAILRAWYSLQAFLLSGEALNAVAQCYDAVVAALKSLPRTVRTVTWAVRAALAYKAFLARYPNAAETDEPFATELAELHVEWAQRLLIVCRNNRGLYVKAGQFASAFGSVPREYRTVLAGLEDRAKPRPYAAVRQVLIEELGPAVETLFEHFDQQATAAASLAQVHKAQLVGGRVVACKVQYPGLQSAVTADLWTMKTLSAAARRFFPSYTLDWLFKELEEKLKEELDFRNEVSNAQRLRSIVGQLPGINLPVMHEPLCSPRIIVMEWVDGCKITDIGALQTLQINARQVGLQLTRLFSELTFIHGYIHADPHPGNLMVRPVGRRNLWSWLFSGTRQPFEIILLDHGTYLTIDPALREMYCSLWCAFVVRDNELAVQVASQLAGERCGRMLPMLLTHQAKNRGEERRMQREVGVTGFGDITRILATARRDLVELLRINGVLRSVTSRLGVTMVDRVRLCGAAARRGLPPRGSVAAGQLPRDFESIAFRIQLRLVMAGIGGYCWAQGMARRIGYGVFSVFGDALFDD